MLLLRNKIQY